LILPLNYIQNIAIVGLIGLSVYFKVYAYNDFIGYNLQQQNVKASDAQYEVYLKNSNIAFANIKNDLVKSLSPQELMYLRREVKQLGVFVDIDLSGKVVSAEVNYFSPLKISDKSKQMIGNTFKKHCQYSFSKKALDYYRGINRKTVTLIYTLPVETY